MNTEQQTAIRKLEEFPSFLNKCLAKTIIVIGDIMLDEHFWCTVNRISPEAPVPVCKVNEITRVPGGAANVSANIKALESQPITIGVIGNDTTGKNLKTTFHNRNLETDYLIEDKNRPTILKTRVIAHHQHVVRVDREEAGYISKQTEKKILTTLSNILSKADAIVLSDYLKGVLTPNVTKNIIKLANEQKIPVIIDPKGSDYNKYKGATVITPNFKEFQTAVKKEVPTEKEVYQQGVRFLKKLNLSALLITRSEKGMSLINENSKKIDIPTHAREVYDITGAGDTCISALAIGIASGLSIEMAARFANYAAGIVVGKVGTATTSITEIHDQLKRDLS